MDKDYTLTITSLRDRGWTRTPQTVEQLIKSLNVLAVEFQGLNDIPYEYSVTITHNMVLDFAQRLLEVEKIVRSIDNEHVSDTWKTISAVLADALRRCEQEPTSPSSWSNAFNALKAYEEVSRGL